MPNTIITASHPSTHLMLTIQRGGYYHLPFSSSAILRQDVSPGSLAQVCTFCHDTMMPVSVRKYSHANAIN